MKSDRFSKTSKLYAICVANKLKKEIEKLKTKKSLGKKTHLRL